MLTVTSMPNIDRRGKYHKHSKYRPPSTEAIFFEAFHKIIRSTRRCCLAPSRPSLSVNGVGIWDVVKAVMNFAPLIRRHLLPSINTAHLRAQKKSETNPAPRVCSTMMLFYLTQQHSELIQKSKTDALSCYSGASTPFMVNRASTNCSASPFSGQHHISLLLPP